MKLRPHPATLRAEHHGPPVAKPVTATLGNPPNVRLSERFEEVGEGFYWAIANRQPGELTIVQLHNKRWRYAERRGRRIEAGWVQE